MKQQNGKQSLSGKAKVQFAMIFNSAAVLESELPTSVSVSRHSYGLNFTPNRLLESAMIMGI